MVLPVVLVIVEPPEVMVSTRGEVVIADLLEPEPLAPEPLPVEPPSA